MTAPFSERTRQEEEEEEEEEGREGGMGGRRAPWVAALWRGGVMSWMSAAEEGREDEGEEEARRRTERPCAGAGRAKA